MKRIDFHTHYFPEKIASRALASLAECAAKKPETDGSLKSTLEKMNEAGITLSVGMPVATRVEQTVSINAFAKEVDSTPGFRSFAGMHPADRDWKNTVDQIKKDGFRGIKLHPDYQGFFVDEEALFPLYRYIGEQGLSILFHAGIDPVSPKVVHHTPVRMKKVLSACPETTFICAHMGGLLMSDEVMEHLAGENVYFDTSIMITTETEERLTNLIRRHGADKILFGTDCPWDNPRLAVERLESLPLTTDEKELIFYKNAEKLLGL